MHTEVEKNVSIILDEQTFRRVCREVWRDSLNIAAETEERQLVTDEESLLLRAILTNLRSELRLSQARENQPQPDATSNAAFYRKAIEETVNAHTQSPFDHDKIISECVRCSHEIIATIRGSQESEVAAPCGMHSSVYVA